MVLVQDGKGFDYTENPHTSWDYLCMLVRVFWKRLHRSGYSGISGVGRKRRRCNQHDLEDGPVHPRTRVG